MKSKTLKIVGVIVVALAIVGSYFYPKTAISVTASPSGTTFSTAKEASIVWTPSNGATSTSILNTDSNDRYIKSIQGMCVNLTSSFTAVTGTGLAALTFSAGTTTTANPTSLASNPNTFLTNQTVATSSTKDYFSTSTPQLGGGSPVTDYARIWTAGSYLTFIANATTSATTACTVGASYLPS